MLFDHLEDALAWYEGEERILTPAFIETIPWHEVSRYPLDARFIPILLYMRDVEQFTGVYYDEIMKTPTGRHPIIRRFVERWNTEEPTHAALLDRFLNEIGHITSPKWIEEARAQIPK